MSNELVDQLRKHCWEIQDEHENDGEVTLSEDDAVSVAQCLMNGANLIDSLAARIADLESIVSRLTNEKAQAEIGAAAWKRAFDNSTIEDIDVGLCDSCHSEVLHVSPGEPVWCKRCVAAGKVGLPAAEAAREKEKTR